MLSLTMRNGDRSLHGMMIKPKKFLRSGTIVCFKIIFRTWSSDVMNARWIALLLNVKRFTASFNVWMVRFFDSISFTAKPWTTLKPINIEQTKIELIRYIFIFNFLIYDTLSLNRTLKFPKIQLWHTFNRIEMNEFQIWHEIFPRVIYVSDRSMQAKNDF